MFLKSTLLVLAQTFAVQAYSSSVLAEKIGLKGSLPNNTISRDRVDIKYLYHIDVDSRASSFHVSKKSRQEYSGAITYYCETQIFFDAGFAELSFSSGKLPHQHQKIDLQLQVQLQTKTTKEAHCNQHRYEAINHAATLSFDQQYLAKHVNQFGYQIIEQSPFLKLGLRPFNAVYLDMHRWPLFVDVKLFSTLWAEATLVFDGGYRLKAMQPLSNSLRNHGYDNEEEFSKKLLKYYTIDENGRSIVRFTDAKDIDYSVVP